MKLRLLVATSGLAGLLLAPLGAAAATSAAVPHASGVVDIAVKDSSNPQFVPDKAKVVGSTVCDPGQMQITNKTDKTLTLVEGGLPFTLDPQQSTYGCFTPGVGGVTYKVKYTIQGYASTLKVTIVPPPPS